MEYVAIVLVRFMCISIHWKFVARTTDVCLLSVVVAGSKPSRERVNGCVSGVASCHASTGMADFEGL